MAAAGGMVQSGITGAFSTVGLAFNIAAGLKWDKEMSKLKDKDPAYTSSPYAQNNLGFAQTLLNSRMGGAAARERNLYGSQANAVSNINRNATDSSQALAAAAAAQGQTNAGFDDLQMREAQDAANKQNNLFNANKDMTVEHKDLFDDSVRRWQDQVNIITAQYKARKQGGDDISNYGAQMGSSIGGMMGGLGGGSFGGGGRGGGGGNPSSGGGSSSDKRLKHNYYVVGKSPSGINIYEFSYIGSNDRYSGVMAQEVPQASFVDDSGYLAVDYNKIDVQFKKL